MKRTITLLSACLLFGLTPLTASSSPANRGAIPAPQTPEAAPAGVPAGQAAKQPQWKSREEYDAFQAILKASTPQEKITAANAFLQKYPNSDFKSQADYLKLQADVQLNEPSQAIAAAKEILKDNPTPPIKVTALHYLAYVFPYVYKPNAAGASSEVSEAASQAKEGLQLLQQLQKPANASQETFETQIKKYRADFNRALGFAALQQKDFQNATTYLKASIEDNPNDSYTFSFLGQAYLFQKPADYNSALWYLAHAISLAQKDNTPNLPALKKLYSQWYEFRHGSNAGEQDLITQAANSPNPPAGFNVAPPKKHAKTGNPNVDAIYQIQDALSVGGDAAQTAWNGYKGQPLGIVAFVESVSSGNSPGTYQIKADVLPEDRGKAGIYQVIVVTDQADAKYLQLNDPIRFQGTIDSYTMSPNFALTISNAKIDPQSLEAASSRAKAKAQQEQQKHPTHRRR